MLEGVITGTAQFLRVGAGYDETTKFMNYSKCSWMRIFRKS